MPKAAVYAIREFKKLSGLNQAALDQILADFPGDSYACIMIRRFTTPTEAQAVRNAKDNPIFTATSGNRYTSGGFKGQPPGGTNPLP